MKKRIHYRDTTGRQREHLFQTWKAVGSVTAACQQAHVSRGTFYYWKSRFDEYGYPGLEEFKSKAPKNPLRTPPDVEERVIDLRRQYPKWGKQRIADELAKANDWKPLVSANTVKRILKDAGLWKSIEAEVKKRAAKSSRTAAKPGQTANIDLCFIPVTHEAADKLPAVSGSSGRLKIESPRTETEDRTWPGQVFDDPELEYTEAILNYVTASQERDRQQPDKRIEAETSAPETPGEERKALLREEAQLRDKRRSLRERRKFEDRAWKRVKELRRKEKQAQRMLSKKERRQQKAVRQASDERWNRIREERQSSMRQRRDEDRSWREERCNLRERLSRIPAIMAWIAVLVVVDNCTRQCFGLPLFTVGAHVTSEMIVEALAALLPSELQFLISDRGVHFKAAIFKKLLSSREIIHVLISRHRPETNGIAERFVRTLKEWLRDKVWNNDQELTILLQQFLEEYNDRPHQGLALPGLSPDEYARRLRHKQDDG